MPTIRGIPICAALIRGIPIIIDMPTIRGMPNFAALMFVVPKQTLATWEATYLLCTQNTRNKFILNLNFSRLVLAFFLSTTGKRGERVFSRETKNSKITIHKFRKQLPEQCDQIVLSIFGHFQQWKFAQKAHKLYQNELKTLPKTK